MKRDLLYKKAKKFIPGISQLFGKDLIYICQEINGPFIILKRKE